MHVLMISLDSTLVTKPDGAAHRRHIDYASRVDHLTIIVYTPVSYDVDVLTPTDHLTIIPTKSLSRFTFVADALRIARRIKAENPPDIITTQDPFSTGLVGWLLRNQSDAPLLVQNHCYFIDNDAWLQEQPLKNGLFNALGKFISIRADVYRTVNEHERDTYLARGGQAERVFTQPLGTASGAFSDPDPQEVAALRSQLGLTEANRVILWVGHPVPFKRVPILLDVFKRVLALDENARLMLIGDLNISKDDLPALMNELGIHDKVIAPGFVNHADLPTYYGLADVYVMTSAYEGIPRVLMEASAAGLPLVGFDRVGVAEVIEDGVNGYLLSEDDRDGMAQRLVELLHDRETAQHMGQVARQRSVERFSAAKNAEGVAAMWADAVALGRR